MGLTVHYLLINIGDSIISGNYIDGICVRMYIYIHVFQLLLGICKKMYYSYLFIIISTAVIVVIVSTPMKDTNCQ